MARGWVLTATVSAQTLNLPYNDVPALSKYLDAIILKTYNMIGTNEWGLQYNKVILVVSAQQVSFHPFVFINPIPV